MRARLEARTISHRFAAPNRRKSTVLTSILEDRMKRLGILLLTGILLVAPVAPHAVAQQSGTAKVSTTYESGDEDSLDLLAGTNRYTWQRPDRVLGLLSLREGEYVADLGAGMGFFSLPMSRTVGEFGKVYAVETDPRLVDYLNEVHAAETYRNTTVIQGTQTDPGLPEGELDLVMTVNTWHRFGDRRAQREAVQKALRPGGRFVVIDWHEGEVPIAPPLARRLPREELIEEMLADGWSMTTQSRMLNYQYLLIFVPPAP
jgi:predicted methyltransferase